jgi:hypothetical protein
MSKTADLKVPVYVLQYVLKKYGPGPYDLSDPRNRGMKVALHYYSLTADAFVPPVLTTTSRVPIKVIYRGNKLVKAYRRYADTEEYNNFFHIQFWEAVEEWIEALRASEDMPKRTALRKFLDYYEIDCEMLPLHSAYRMLNRWLERRWTSTAS